MTRKALITGATGLLGRQVLKAFKNAGWDVVGAGFSRARPPSIIKLDVFDQAAISSTLDDIRYAALLHSCLASKKVILWVRADATEAIDPKSSYIVSELEA